MLPPYYWGRGYPDEWQFWYYVYRSKSSAGKYSLERVALEALHSTLSLNFLAEMVCDAFEKAGKPVAAAVESVWIDGTPQASGKTVSGQDAKCELADLLFLVDERSLKNQLVRRSGLLLQGKLSTKHNKLHAGGSTRKERSLLEDLDRRQPLELFRDTGRASLIGKYQMPIDVASSYRGLRGFARYLLMPKSLHHWPAGPRFSPFQVGWPSHRHDSTVSQAQPLIRAVERVAVRRSLGREVIDPNTCEWSRLVYDLLDGYRAPMPVAPGRVASQQHAHAGVRVNSSQFVASSFHARSTVEKAFRSLPPSNIVERVEGGGTPAINVVALTVMGNFAERIQD